VETGIYRFILKYSRNQQVLLLVITALSFPFLYLSLDLPKIIINEAIGGSHFPSAVFGVGPEFEQVPYLLVLCFLFLVLVLINGLFKLYINIYRGSMGERLLRRMRYQLIANVQRFPLPHFRNISQGEVVSIVTTETEPLGGFMGEALSLPAFQGGTLLTLLAFMFVQDWALGVAAIALYPVQMVLIPKLQRRVNELGKRRVREVRKLSERLSELVGGIHEMHANDTGQYELADFGSRLGTIFSVRVEIYRKKFFIKFLNNFLAQLTPFFFFSIGGYYVIQGDLSFGALVATLAAYKDLSAPWKELLTYYQKMEDSRIKYKQLIERFEPPKMFDETLLEAHETVDVELAGDVVANNLTVEDEEGNKLVSGASFSFRSTDHVALIRNPGSGAGDIARLLARQVFPTAGTITIGGHNLVEMPSAVTGRQLSYVDGDVYVSAGTLRDNLFYGLKNYPRRQPEPDAEARRLADESKLSGNSAFDRDADWIDYPVLGLDGPEGLKTRALDVLGIVGLEADAFELGLRRSIDPTAHPKIAEGILEVRAAIHGHIEDPAIAGLVQVYDRDAYNTNASVAENILHGSSTSEDFAVDNLGSNAYVLDALEKVGLRESFLDMGLNVASLMVELFSDLPMGHEFFERFSFIEADALPDFQRMINIAGNRGLEALSDEERDRLRDLPFKLTVARHRLGLITPEIQEKLLDARHILADSLPDDVRQTIDFYDIDTYNGTGTLLDNALFGKVASDKPDSRERVVEFVTAIIDELGMRPAIVEMGLDYDVGIGGRRLSQDQRQKLGLARALIKNSHMMVVNNALAMLPQADQASLLDRVRAERRDRGLFWVTGDADAAAEFDVVLVAEGGKVRAADHEGLEIVEVESETEAADGETELGQNVELLAGVPIFGGLDRSQRKLLAFASDRKTVAAGEVLFRQDEPGEKAYVVIEGQFDILVSGADGPLKVAEAGPGAVVGELALLCDAPRTATVRATSPAAVLRISKDVFLHLVRDNAEVGSNLSKIIAGRLEKMVRGYVARSLPLYDEITGLPSRHLFMDRVTHTVDTDAREGKKSSLILLKFGESDALQSSLDNEAKVIVLKEVADRLRGCLRRADSLARLEEFSFGVIAKNAADGNGGNGGDPLTNRIRHAFDQPLAVEGRNIDLSETLDLDTYPLLQKHVDAVFRAHLTNVESFLTDV